MATRLAASAMDACSAGVSPVVPMTIGTACARQTSSQCAVPSGSEKSIITSGIRSSTEATFTPIGPVPARSPMSFPMAVLPATSRAETISNCPVSTAMGKILCISSVHEVIPWAGHVNYAASKGGVMLMMKSVAQELAPLRIRVNSVCPGAIRTPINREAWDTPEALNSLLRLIPYKRIGEPDDIARAVYYFIAEAPYVTGQMLSVDGGRSVNM